MITSAFESLEGGLALPCLSHFQIIKMVVERFKRERLMGEGYRIYVDLCLKVSNCILHVAWYLSGPTKKRPNP